MNCFEDDSLNSLLFQFIRLYHSRAFALFGKLGVCRGQPPILRLLWHKDGRSQKEIAEILHLKPSTITDIIQRMEKSELLERKVDPEDLRVLRVHLTDKGREIMEDLRKTLGTLENECFRSFTHEDKLLFRRFLTQIRGNLLNSTDAEI